MAVLAQGAGTADTELANPDRLCSPTMTYSFLSETTRHLGQGVGGAQARPKLGREASLATLCMHRCVHNCMMSSCRR